MHRMARGRKFGVVERNNVTRILLSVFGIVERSRTAGDNNQ